MRWLMLSLIFLVLSSNIHAEQAYGTNSKELIELAGELNGKTVLFRGEVIGDQLVREGYVWLSVADQYNAMSVWAPVEIAKDIHSPGDYNHEGDRVEIEGQFFRSDPKMGGELYIRAYAIRVLGEGFVIPHTASPLKINLALFLFIFTALTGVLVLMIHRGRRK